MTTDRRFRVNFSQNQINLYGVITDSTEFKNIDELIKPDSNLKSIVLNCEHLTGASWNGLINLDKYLSSKQGLIELINIPYVIFKNIRLMPDVNTKFNLESFYLLVIDKNKNTFFENFSCKILSELDHKEKTEFYHLLNEKQIIGKLNHLFPSRFGKKVLKEELNLDHTNDWYKLHYDEYNFWYDYVSFLVTNISLTRDMVDSLSDALKLLVLDIHYNIKHSQAAIKKLLPNNPDLNADTEVEQIAKSIDESNQLLSSTLSKTETLGNYTLLLLQQMTEKQKNEGLSIYTYLTDFFDAYKQLNLTITKIEDIGYNTGERIRKISVTKSILDKLQIVDHVEPTLLSEVRDIMEIMDPLSEDSWPDTKEEFIHQIKQIDQNIFDAIVLIQGFDLIRQVLEHRMSEVRYILNNVQKSELVASWEEIQTKVFELIHKTLVTDQEKYSCYFFLPESRNKKVESEKKEENKSPGDVMFF